MTINVTIQWISLCLVGTASIHHYGWLNGLAILAAPKEVDIKAEEPP